MKIIAQNKKARHDYFIDDTYEAGIKLVGSEIKSIRQGKANINDAYIDINNGELYIIGMHISKYKQSAMFNHDEKRDRKLLMHKREIIKLGQKKDREGYTLIPLKLYFKEALVKVEIGVAKGKKLYDKREDIKKRDEERSLRNV